MIPQTVEEWCTCASQDISWDPADGDDPALTAYVLLLTQNGLRHAAPQALAWIMDAWEIEDGAYTGQHGTGPYWSAQDDEEIRRLFPCSLEERAQALLLAVQAGLIREDELPIARGAAGSTTRTGG